MLKNKKVIYIALSIAWLFLFLTSSHSCGVYHDKTIIPGNWMGYPTTIR